MHPHHYSDTLRRPFGLPIAPNAMTNQVETKDTKQTKFVNVGFTDDEYAKARENAQGVPLAKALRESVVYPSSPAATENGVPLLGAIHAGDEGLDEYQCRQETDRLVHCSEHPHGPAYGYIEIEGDCMNKRVPQGAIALFRRRLPRNGDAVAVMLTWPDCCEFTLKVISFQENGDVLLSPDSTNPKHKPILLSEEDPKDSKVIWLQPDRADTVGVFTGGYIVKAESK